MLRSLIPPAWETRGTASSFSFAFYFAFGSAVTIIFSIAISQILLALSIALLLLSGERLRFPPILKPFAAFLLITVAALAASPDPRGGTPQIRKFYIFAMLLVICSTFKTLRQVRALILAWAVCGAGSALLGIAQFVARHREAIAQHTDYYGYFLDRRITGFAGHWMTFGGEEMIVLLMIAACLLFSKWRPWHLAGWSACALLAAAIVLGMTRCIFLLGLPAGLAYLLWQRRRLLPLLGLVAVAAVILVSPRTVQERVVSVFNPHQGLDSNAHRAVCRAVGWQMVKAHPWLGLGPEQVGRQFNRYIPAGIGLPLPSGWYGHLHNVYLQYAAERGVFALAAMLWLIAKVTYDLLRGVRDHTLTREARGILHGVIAVIVAVLAEGLFEYNLGDSEVLTLFLCSIACGYVILWSGASPSASGRQSSSESARFPRLLTNPLRLPDQTPAGHS